MTYENAIEYVNSLLRFGMKPGLDRMKNLLNLLGNPQKDLKFIHVAGTNGKGSTCAFLNSVFKCAGFKTGLYISPFIIDFRERIQINGNMIPKKDFSELIDYIIPFVNIMQKKGEYITEFELITAAAFLWFKKENCDIVVLEVGLGGRFDATNVIDRSLVSVITSISFDHVNILGKTIRQIANEKAGIIKPGGTVVLYPEQKDEVLSVIKSTAENLQNKIVIPDLKEVSEIEFSLGETKFKYKGTDFKIGILGKHQINNAITALTVIYELINIGFLIPEDKIKLGMIKTSFPARFEVVLKKPLIILDGAHNQGGAVALAESIDLYLKNRNIIAVVGMLKDKDVTTVMKTIAPKVSEFIITKPDNNRAMCEKDLKDVIVNFNRNCTVTENVDEAIRTSLSKLNENSAVLVFGSLYLTSQVRTIMKNIIF